MKDIINVSSVATENVKSVRKEIAQLTQKRFSDNSAVYMLFATFIGLRYKTKSKDLFRFIALEIEKLFQNCESLTEGLGGFLLAVFFFLPVSLIFLLIKC